MHLCEETRALESVDPCGLEGLIKSDANAISKTFWSRQIPTIRLRVSLPDHFLRAFNLNLLLALRQINGEYIVA